MKEESFFFRDKFIIAHDDEMLNFIFHTASTILFPLKVSDRRNRESFLKLMELVKDNSWPTDDSALKKIDNNGRKAIKRGFVVGEACRLQCLLALEWETTPSIRFLEYAIEKGLYQNWVDTGYPFNSVRTLYPKYKSILHLWAADSYMNTNWRTGDDMPLQNLLASPRLFLGFAAFFRNLCFGLGLVDKKTNLWMPKGWKEIVSDCWIDEEVITTKQWDIKVSTMAKNGV